MKKSVSLILVSLLFFSVLSVSLISADFFGSWFDKLQNSEDANIENSNSNSITGFWSWSRPRRAYCGDGKINVAGEQCDRTNLGGKTCQTQGFGGGTLSCDLNNCRLVTNGCTANSATVQKTCEQTRTLTRRTIGENLCSSEETKITLRSSYRSCSGAFYRRTCRNYYDYSCVKTTTTTCSLTSVCPTGMSEIGSTSCSIPDISANSWVFVFTNEGVDISTTTINYFCDTVRSQITSWINREATKYNQQVPFDKIVCIKEQVQLPTELLRGDFSIFTEGQTVVSPLKDDRVVAYLEQQIPSLKKSKYTTVIHYIGNLPSFNHAYSEKYSFVFIQANSLENQPDYYYNQLAQQVFDGTITHEFMHQLGAFDKYSRTINQACIIDPRTALLYNPQEYDGHDIMCHRVYINPERPEDGLIQPRFDELIVSEPTAEEIGWLAKDIQTSLNQPYIYDWVLGSVGNQIQINGENFTYEDNQIIILQRDFVGVIDSEITASVDISGSSDYLRFTLPRLIKQYCFIQECTPSTKEIVPGEYYLFINNSNGKSNPVLFKVI